MTVMKLRMTALAPTTKRGYLVGILASLKRVPHEYNWRKLARPKPIPLKGRKPDSSHRVREVRIHFPPAASLLRINSAADRPAAGAAHVSIRSAGGQMRKGTTAEVRLDQGKATSSSDARPAILGFRSPGHPSWATFVVRAAQKQDHGPGRPRNLENVG